MLNEVENEYTKKKLTKSKLKTIPKTYIVRTSNSILEVNIHNKITNVVLNLNKPFKDEEIKNSFKDKLENSSKLLKQNKKSDDKENKKSKKYDYYVCTAFDYKCQSSTYTSDGGNVTIKTIDVTRTKYKVVKDGMRKIRKVITDSVQSYRRVKVYNHRKMVHAHTSDLSKKYPNLNPNFRKKDFSKLNNYLKNSNNLCVNTGSLVDTETSH